MASIAADNSSTDAARSYHGRLESLASSVREAGVREFVE
jgi:hypothetical protein